MFCTHELLMTAVDGYCCRGILCSVRSGWILLESDLMFCTQWIDIVVG